MNSTYRKSVLAGAIAAFVALPMGVAAADPATEGQAKPPMRSEMGASGSLQAAQGDLQSMTPSQLRGAEVIGTNGESIGSVKSVVHSRQDKNIQAVISVGGFLGFGDKEIAVPLEELQYEGGKLRLSATEDELKARPEIEPTQYVELQPKDQPISEFSAFEPMPETAPDDPAAAPTDPAKGSTWDSGRSSEPEPAAPGGGKLSE